MEVAKSDRSTLIGEISVVDNSIGSKYPADVLQATRGPGNIDKNGVTGLLVNLNLATDKVTQSQRFTKLSVQYRVLTVIIWILLLGWIAILTSFIITATVANLPPLDFWEAVNVYVKGELNFEWD